MRDHHDDAYRWAENRKLTINPVTGAMQMLTFESVTQQVPDEAPSAKAAVAEGVVEDSVATVAPTLFGEMEDRDLMSLGVPQELLGFVRSIASEDELERQTGAAPTEAYEGLFLVAAGDTVSQVLNARETR